MTAAPVLPLAERPAVKAASRLVAVDWLRGLVMVIMTVDHASGAFNAGRLFTDSAMMYKAGTVLDPAQFLTRWITHLCAPTFVFLAGLSLAISEDRRRARGEPAGSLDRYLVTRGLIIAACDPLWMSLAFNSPGRFIFQVLYAIGIGFVCMAALRRIPRRAIGAIALFVIVGHEALARIAIAIAGGGNAPIALLFTGGMVGPIMVAYPVIPWLGIMMLGYSLGGIAAAEGAERLARRFAVAGAISLAIFGVVRGVNGYGNAALYREGSSILQWIHVSKYPPSLAYAALELGLMAILLALFLRIPKDLPALRPLAVFGQTAFFFYLLHAHLLEGAARLLGLHKHAGLPATYASAAIVVALLYPLCMAYRRYKAARPDGWTRYL